MVAEWATPDLGSTAPADLEPWEGPSDQGGLLCFGSRDSARRRSLREVIATAAAERTTDQSAVRRLVTGTDDRLVINPYIVAPHARLANALMAVAPRNAFGVPS